MLSLARALRLTVQRQHVCEILRVYWERLRFLAHESPVVFDETCLWKHAIRSHLHPSKKTRTGSNNISKITHTHTQQDDFSVNFNRILILADNRFFFLFYEQSLMKVHIFPSSLKMAFPISQLSGGNPFSGPS